MLNWQMCSAIDSKTNVFVHNEKTLKKARLKEWRNGESTLMQIMEVMKVPDLEFYGFFLNRQFHPFVEATFFALGHKITLSFPLERA